MAKGNMLLGFARGKVGSLVFKRQNGKQVTAPRVTPKNPQTLNQMAQRIAFASAVKTAKELDGIVDHSFQGVEYGQKSIQHFTSKAAKVIKANIMAALDSKIGATPFRNTAAIPLSAISVGSAAELLVSSGDLTSPLYSVQGTHIALGTSTSFALTGNVTVANYASILGVPYTDQLTFVAGIKRALNEVEGDTIFYGADFHYVRLNWKKNLAADAVLFTYGEGSVMNINTENVDFERSSAVFANYTGDLPLSGDGIHIMPDVFDGVENTDTIVCGCVIASRYENGAWRRSAERLSGVQLAQASTQAAASEAWAWNPVDELIASAMKAANVSEDWYLNKKKVTE